MNRYDSDEQRSRLRSFRSASFLTPGTLAATLTVIVATMSVSVLSAQVAAAASDVVTTCASSGPGSLPAAVADASGTSSTISFSVSCPASSPIVLTSTLDINVDLRIDGPGAREVVISGNNAVEVFDVAPGGSAILNGLTIEDGNSDSNSDGGINTGGVSNNGSLSIEDSIVENNTASGAGSNAINTGGIANAPYAILDILDTTVANNSATGSGTDINTGGIYNAGTFNDVVSTLYGNSGIGGTDTGAIYSTGTLQTVNSTIDENSGLGGVGVNTGGIDAASGTAAVGTTVLAHSTGNDCFSGGGHFGDAGANLADDNTCGFVGPTDLSDTPSGLDPSGLENNGGPTPTVAIEPGSAAIGAIPDMIHCSLPDQRGKTRPVPCDIGAFETDDYFSQAITFTSTPPTPPMAGGPTYSVSASASSGLPVVLSIDPSASSICSLAGSSVSFTNEGVCVIDANQAGNGGYSAAPQFQQSFWVDPAPPAITSADYATATVGGPFSFTVTTSASPVHSIAEKGKLPKGVTFVENGNGTATMSGKPVKAGVRHLAIRATFGAGRTKVVVTQAFTLTIERA